MIITALQGGLGNQMFQYAFGKALSIKHLSDLKIDKQNLSSGIPPREYELGIFGINGPFASTDEIRKLKPADNLLTQNSPKINRFLSMRKRTYINELFSGGKIPVVAKDLYVDGYWQSVSYFKNYSSQIRRSLQFARKPTKYVAIWLKKISSTNSVSVHVRRTDYVDRKGRAAIAGCSLGYYRHAMSLVAKKISKPVFYVFSDDTSWAKKNLVFLGFETNFPSSLLKRDHNIDMLLMSKCNHNIVANSSFSWWGAWLNNHPNKIVVAPDPWFSAKIKGREEIIPRNWMRVAKNHV